MISSFLIIIFILDINVIYVLMSISRHDIRIIYFANYTRIYN